ncbi:MAG: alkyl sulfatase dimerization domain-containing protein [Thermaurantiacus tibetensis]|uniref:alkyl sulfatase dimerization domain-containing protein n=1 Tax=Thermaurantiacus tibetensis TaxID=2759035 RepID=UPI00188F95FA|nr:alkyl sulfatase dimerization domain-containing protein [Thermaurantiacus tibetensis]
MADLLELSRRVIDGEVALGAAGPLNRITHELSELADGIAMVEAFSHAILFATDEGLLVFDTSNEWGGARVVEAVRGWREDPFATLVFTHGHIDHVGGAGAFLADAEARGARWPRVVAHENVPARFARYRLTDGWNHAINARQFGQFRRRGYDLAGAARFLPETTPEPDTLYRDRLALEVGGLAVELRHAKGETDDHSWAWIPAHRAICAGDFFIWAFPNAGNPQKAQRYPREWAAALREMAGMGAELFLPAHGLPIAGAARIRRVLLEVAGALESLVRQTLDMMNAGARLDDILHAVKVDPALLEKPWLAPVYDDPEFVVRNIWRLYGGWWDGEPANLKPAPVRALAGELAALAGGPRRLAERAAALLSSDLRLACHLVDFAAAAAPEDGHVHAIRAAVYQARRDAETSLMAKGIFGAAANESKVRAGEGQAPGVAEGGGRGAEA